jgi:peptidoglycan/xylan/chitin deacetylase (PgdA/CDA1 family)
MRRLGAVGIGIAAMVAAVALAPGPTFAQSCQPLRTIQLGAGDRIGALTPGYRAAPLQDREVILTFDDGPNPESTPRILDILKARCLTATFFAIGDSAAKHPELVRRGLAEGHTVGGHTNWHRDLTTLTMSEATEDITAGFVPLLAAGGLANLFRFPQLNSTPELLNWLARRGMAAVSADIDPHDWAADPPEETLARLKEQLNEKRRGVILLHDNQPNTAELLTDLLDFLDGQGYRVVGLAGPGARSPD